jgi:acyl-CoA reductase-like NAD-dependent aldehyde dehydrogenase
MSKYWTELASAVRWDIRPLIDGRRIDSKSDEVFEDINPATETPLCEVAVGGSEDVDAAVRIGRKRFAEGAWSQLQPGRRGDILCKLAELIVEHKEQIALLDTLEMGKPIRSALFDAEQWAAPLTRAWAGFADKLLGVSAPLINGNVAFNAFEPRGVVGAVTPWNFPSVNAVYKIVPALAAGNCVVVKPSEIASGSTLRIAELALEAGVPPGVLNVVPGLGATAGSALASHRDVDLVSFTGSTATGRRIMELAGRSNGKPLLLELGGKSPSIVFEDVENLDRVADDVVFRFTSNSGQWCSAHSRLIVHRDVKEALLSRVLSRAQLIQPADPLETGTTFGPLASPAQRARVARYIEDGIAAGAAPVLRGPIRARGGCFVSPTIFDRVSPEMAIVREEIFGPVLCVQKFETDEEAVALANGTDYGLTATLWTRDAGRGRRVAQAVQAGYIQIRTSGVEASGSGCVLGHEPHKASGFGSEQGLQGLRSYSKLKSYAFMG